MIDTHIDLGQILILAGGATAFISSLVVTRARQEDMKSEFASFQERIENSLHELKTEVKEDLSQQRETIFTMSGQVQRIIGAMGSQVRATDHHKGL